MWRKDDGAIAAVQQIEVAIATNIQCVDIDHHGEVCLPHQSGYELNSLRFLTKTGAESNHRLALEQRLKNSCFKISGGQFTVLAFFEWNSHQLGHELSDGGENRCWNRRSHQPCSRP